MSTASNSSLKQSCSALASLTSALEVINVMCSINPRFTYLLTYLTANYPQDYPILELRAETECAQV